jgi:twitching motility protein PilT
LVNSLLTAIVRADGDALVMHVGEQPYVVAASGPVELSSRPLTLEAVAGMLGQLLPSDSRRALEELGAIEYELPRSVAASAERFTVVAARGGDDIWIEIRRHRAMPVASPAPAAAPVAAEVDSAPAPAPLLPAVPAADVIDEVEIPLEFAEPFDAPEEPVAQVPADTAPEQVAPPPVADAFELPAPPVPSLRLPPVMPPAASTSRPMPAVPAGPPQERFVAPLQAPVERPEKLREPIAPVLPSPALERFAAIRSSRPADPILSPRPEPMSEVQDQAPFQTEPSQAVVLPLARNPVRPDTLPRQSPPPRIAGLDRLLRLAAARGATTIFLMSNGRPSVRVDGEIVPLDGEPVLTASEVESLLLDMAPERNREALRNGVGTEWMSEVPEVGRFRCQSFRDHRGPGGIFRMISTRPASVDQLGLSREIQALCAETEGLVLVAGPRSSGKSTLITAFVDLINRTRNDYVITIESQIACAHENRGCLISQREVRGNGEDLAAAVRAGLRENPDVLVIEDLRSPKVVALALEAMESGHLVIGAMSAHTSTTAIGRIVDQFPHERRDQVQLMLAEGLRGVVSQVLLKKSGGGRVAAREVLLNTSAIASLIADGRISQLPLALDSGRKHGMVPLNDALAGFVQNGIVDVKEAYRQAFERQAFLAVLRREGVDTSFVERLA